MLHKETNVPASAAIILPLVFLNVLILKVAFVENEKWYWALLFTMPALLLAIYRGASMKTRRFT